MGRRGRGIRDDERALWTLATQTMRPIQRPFVPPAPPPEASPPNPSAAASGEAPRAAPISPFRIGEAPRSEPVPPAPPPAPATSVDRRTLSDLKAGRRAPEARLDLHGMTLDEAYSALSGFLAGCAARNLRLVHVITGKGGSKGGVGGHQRGALRRQVPLWLRTPPMSLWVRETMVAHNRHGGDGALYVWLRRRR